jgi:hypothetical protein
MNKKDIRTEFNSHMKITDKKDDLEIFNKSKELKGNFNGISQNFIKQNVKFHRLSYRIN